MAVTFSKVLATGQLSDELRVLYTVPPFVMARVWSIRCLNAGASGNTVMLAVQEAGGEAREILAVTLAPGDMLVDSARLDMGAGDTLLGQVSISDTVSYVISGEEEDTRR